METPAINAIETIQLILSGQGYTNIHPDGDIGRITLAAIRDLDDHRRTGPIGQIQEILVSAGYNLQVDGQAGPLTFKALYDLDERGDHESLADQPIQQDRHHHGKASFFAGPQDIAAFRRCKSAGGSDVHCFAFGDNGIGAWGKDCTSQNKPMAALPREVWRNAGKKGGARLAVAYKNQTVEGELGDTLPALANIHNGVMIDLNPAFAAAFGISPSEMNNHTLEDVTWDWL